MKYYIKCVCFNPQLSFVISKHLLVALQTACTRCFLWDALHILLAILHHVYVQYMHHISRASCLAYIYGKMYLCIHTPPP